eukprot:5645906-Pyramimonas_sp.AAC.1
MGRHRTRVSKACNHAHSTTDKGSEFVHPWWSAAGGPENATRCQLDPMGRGCPMRFPRGGLPVRFAYAGCPVGCLNN